MNDAPDGNIYCKGCYGNKFGLRGYGFGGGAGTLTTVMWFKINVFLGMLNEDKLYLDVSTSKISPVAAAV